MAYLFPYAGSERKPALVVKKLKKEPKKVAAPPPPPPAPQDLRPIELPVMPESLRKILLEVCEHHNVHPNDVAGMSRAAKFINARRHYVVRARHETDHSYPRIARAIRKDHTSAVHLFAQWRKEGDKTIAVWKPPAREAPTGPRRKTKQLELTPNEKLIISLVKNGLSFEEIAERRNIRVKSARAAYTDGLRKMKRIREAENELV